MCFWLHPQYGYGQCLRWVMYAFHDFYRAVLCILRTMPSQDVLPSIYSSVCHTLLPFLSINLKVIFLALPILPSHVLPLHLQITIYVTYGTL